MFENIALVKKCFINLYNFLQRLMFEGLNVEIKPSIIYSCVYIFNVYRVLKVCYEVRLSIVCKYFPVQRTNDRTSD